MEAKLQNKINTKSATEHGSGTVRSSSGTEDELLIRPSLSQLGL